MKRGCLILAALLSASSRVAADGLVPCGAEEADGYNDVVEAVINHPNRGTVIASFTAFPSFQPEWGVRIIRTDGKYLLRAVQFHKSVWYSGYREVRPGTFARSPSAARYQRTVREVSVSRDFAELLGSALSREIAGASVSNERFGFDGETYMFSAAEACATSWSPESGSRPARLVDLFETLKTQASLPTRWLQIFWERRAYGSLLLLSGTLTMSTSDYLFVFALGAGIVLFASLPLVIAAVVMLIPRRVVHKRKFIFVSGAMSYGCTCLLGLVLLPFWLASTQLAAQLEVDGLGEAALAVNWIGEIAPIVLFVFWLMASLVVPLYLRGKWAALTIATQQPVQPDRA